MIQSQVKLRLSATVEKKLNKWLWMLTGVHNFVVEELGLDAKGGFYYTSLGFQNLLGSHGKKTGIPGHTVQGMLSQVHKAWSQCLKKIGGKPKLKGTQKKLNSISFPDPIRAPEGNYLKLPSMRKLRFHRQAMPVVGKIKCGHIVKCAFGWYLCLFIDAERQAIPRTGNNGIIGIDPNFKDLLTTSGGEKIIHPQELLFPGKHLAQAQRAINRKLVARLHERIKDQCRNHNHKTKDNTEGITQTFGKGVASSAHLQLRSLLDYKSRTGGTQYTEVESKNSTRACSACGCLTGPKGLAGLSIRQWMCIAYRMLHDRGMNASIIPTHYWGWNDPKGRHVA